MSQGEIKHAFANPALVADNEIVAAVDGMKIKVLAALLIAAGATTATFKSAATAISAGIPLAANGGAVFPLLEGQTPWFKTNSGEALNCALSAAETVGVHVIYKLERA